jgi:TIR domain
MNNSFSTSQAGHIFISYSHRDKPFVNQLTSDLRSRGFSVWVDTKGIPAGSPDWEKAIRAAIARARSLIYIASPDSLNSSVAKDELAFAKQYKCPIYILLIAGKHHLDSIPMGLGYTQFIDARGRYNLAFHELVTALNSPPPPTVNVPVPPPTSYGLPAFPPPNSNTRPRRSYPTPRRALQAAIVSLFVSVITTFVVTFIIKVFTLVIQFFSAFASMAGKPNADPSQLAATFGQFADFSNPLPLVIGIIAGILAAILTVSFFTK